MGALINGALTQGSVPICKLYVVRNMQDVEINREPVELYKVLKFEGLVGTGGEAKMVIAEGMVKVNGETEMRKRRKLHTADIVEFNGRTLRLVLAC